MTKIDGATQLAEIIGQQLGSLRCRERIHAGTRTADTKQKQSSSKTQTEESHDLADLVAKRVSVINPDDPQRDRKAFNIFLESVLLAEIGKNLINDPGFHHMVNKVQDQMEADAELLPLIKQATALLLSSFNSTASTNSGH